MFFDHIFFIQIQIFVPIFEKVCLSCRWRRGDEKNEELLPPLQPGYLNPQIHPPNYQTKPILSKHQTKAIIIILQTKSVLSILLCQTIPITKLPKQIKTKNQTQTHPSTKPHQFNQSSKPNRFYQSTKPMHPPNQTILFNKLLNQFYQCTKPNPSNHQTKKILPMRQTPKPNQFYLHQPKLIYSPKTN